ncbi:biotin--[acetyl-CoA-carboxylase] ligase [Erythrobacter rubeus]|uniref:biotin--[biotin carboxyl-carrier protein] ligase n=1 Tax=Erythrobacter rubeus TaxID=2760803 RepID=A0ABR8KQC2_9SPHN|nr:biotin--[acetyl-CoA-carboxylase] ligase [Erythrobacter rubeus]MBD2841710.1 biotin--[acetyl-CoA-carboxylase] ligase [Erythrobacter rubeus]
MITFVEETGSTNADLAAAVRAGERVNEGSWLVAERQNAGRGRQGREWFDGSGNFMGSTVVAIKAGDKPPATLSFVAALSVFEAASDAVGDGANVQLKWPNDVMLEGAKLSGILLEMVAEHVVVGIGVNLAQAPDLAERRIVAIADFVKPPPLRDFADDLARVFARELQSWRDTSLSDMLERFLALSIHSQGAPIRVHDADGEFVEGTFAGLEESDGALRLRLADGAERVIRAGDIS